jgi:hypothetical protein
MTEVRFARPYSVIPEERTGYEQLFYQLYCWSLETTRLELKLGLTSSSP